MARPKRFVDDGPTGLARSLQRIVGRITPEVASAFAAIAQHWPTIVGDELGAATRPSRLEDGVLTVTASSGAYATAIKLAWVEIQAGIERLDVEVPSRLAVTTRGWSKGSSEGDRVD